MEENEAVRMSYCELGLSGWVEENKAVRMRCWTLWVGRWVDGVTWRSVRKSIPSRVMGG